GRRRVGGAGRRGGGGAVVEVDCAVVVTRHEATLGGPGAMGGAQIGLVTLLAALDLPIATDLRGRGRGGRGARPGGRSGRGERRGGAPRNRAALTIRTARRAVGARPRAVALLLVARVDDAVAAAGDRRGEDPLDLLLLPGDGELDGSRPLGAVLDDGCAQ